MAKIQRVQSASKKVGTSRVTRKGRTVAVGAAKHSYKTVAAAKTAYTRLRSAKAVQGFKFKYGPATRKSLASCTRILRPLKITRKAAPKRRKAVRKTTRKTAPKRRVARKNPVRRTTRRNAPVSRAEAGTVRAILRRHGYIA